MMEISSKRWLAWGISLAILGLLLAYDTWEGVGNFVGVANQGAALSLSISPFGTFAIYLNVLAPSLIFVLTIVITLATRLRLFAVWFVLALMLSALIAADLVLGTSAYLIYSAN